MGTVTEDDRDSRIDQHYKENAGAYTANLSDREREIADLNNNFYNQTADPTTEDTNAANARLKLAEQKSDDAVKSFYNPAGGNLADQVGKLSPGKIQAILKKKGPLGLLGAIVLGGGTAGIIMTAPSLGIIHMKETLLKDLNDQLATLDIRKDYVFRAKLDRTMMAGADCSGAGNIRCRASTVGGKAIGDFERAGFKVECDGGCSTATSAKNSITKITYPDGTAFDDPAKAIDHARTSLSGASKFRLAYNPVYRGFQDGPAKQAFEKVRISKKSVLTDGTKEENNKRVKEAVKNGTTLEGRPISSATDEEAKKQQQTFGDEVTERANEVSSSGVKASSNLVSGTAKGLGIIGGVDAACTAYRTGLAIEAGAKVIRAYQLARFAMSVGLNVADEIKAGDGSPVKAAYSGDILTAVDSRKEITVPAEGGATKTIPNPNYNKNAFDSDLYKAAAYNEAPKLSNLSQQYTVGGAGPLAALSSVNGTIKNVLGDSPRDTCNVVQSGVVRFGSLLVGIVAGVFSGGTTIALNVAASASIAIAMSFAEQALIDLLAGTAVDESTTGAQAGDAMFAGTAVINGEVAQARGLSPLSLDGVKNYTVARAETNTYYASIDRYEAKDQPLDVTNQYTFVGSLATNLATPLLESKGSNPLAQVASILTQPLKMTRASALADTFNPERYQQCNDQTYQGAGYAPDVACNLRYGLSNAELAMDTRAVYDYMINNNYIDEAKGNPVPGSDFEKYVKSCTLRTTPLGSSGSEEQADDYTDGKVCSDQADMFRYFRVYIVDRTMSDDIDGGEPFTVAGAAATPAAGNSSSENSGVVDASGWAFPTVSNATITQYFTQDIHNAWDIGMNGTNVPVFAAHDGVVTAAGNITETPPYIQPCFTNGSIQQVVIIKHDTPNGVYYTSYHHVAAGSITVSPGTTVKAGDRIATMGNTGCSYGQHLHFEIWRNSIYGGGTPLDPSTVWNR